MLSYEEVRAVEVRVLVLYYQFRMSFIMILCRWRKIDKTNLVEARTLKACRLSERRVLRQCRRRLPMVVSLERKIYSRGHLVAAQVARPWP